MRQLKTYDELIRAISVPGGVIVKFSASWCGPCRQIKPIFEDLSRKVPTVAFYEVDVDEAQEMTEKVGITTMPTFLVFQNGKQIDGFLGASTDKLFHAITKLTR
jgi:thioredoxin 1